MRKDCRSCVLFQADRDVEVIKMEDNNTVKSLRDKLQVLMFAGREDSGFPILREDDAGPRLVGYIGASELEHALGMCSCISASFVQVADCNMQLSLLIMPPRRSDSAQQGHISKVGRCLHRSALQRRRPSRC